MTAWSRSRKINYDPIILERSMDLFHFSKRVLILVTTHNRAAVTKVCLSNLSATKGQASLWIYDDSSTDYDLDFLRGAAPHADKVVRTESNLGVDRLRYTMQLDAFDAPFDYVYHCDNDAFHDPQWLQRLFEMSQAHQGPIGLYNSRYHTGVEKNGILYSETCPGISFFYRQQDLKRDLVETLLRASPKRSWDYVLGDLLGVKAISQQSYVEHFGAGGIHNNDFERDRAMNPTPYLRKIRPHIIAGIKSEEKTP